MRDRFAEYLEKVDGSRFRIMKHGQDRAYLIGVREVWALEETLSILESTELLQSLRRSLADLQAGRVRDATEVFAELDAEFDSQE
jgi:PHD/YefM family antitoxin component YafN of YafNO toxin-antitoxin module